MYTKGEWKLEFDKIKEGSDRTVAIILDGSYEEKVANARLIAAAPKMYEALTISVGLLVAIDTKASREVADICRQAISEVEEK